MFEIGDNIVYPMQGAGVIESIQEKEVQGETQQYFVIRLLIKKMEVMIPISKMDNSRIRLVVDSKTLENVLNNFHNGESDRILPYKERFKVNMEKMKTGNIEEGAEVVRDLMRIDKEKALNSSEKQMLGNASKILISELGLIKGINENEAKELLYG
ncbi:CarD family transcriptional regulator [Bacillus sp. EAC]|uniref:CarD family transcriptional regulator n=1 Tax=Bacillus sp. EAC TaxID=1978338 RepID=UPI000B4476F7|nr:CarD family transcriptional regulator [Bacillus sp. EAC]